MGSTLFTAIAMCAASIACVIHYLLVSHGTGPSAPGTISASSPAAPS